MLANDDTIAAIATAPGSAAIGIVRVSGPRAAAILEEVVGRDLRREPRRLSLLTARDHQGAAIDEVLAVLMPGPRSYTGEDVAELQGHGGIETMRGLLDAVVAAGARVAEAGEFSRRAFENGRMDLAQAEGILALIGAGSERAVRVGQALLAGELSARISSLRERCNALLAVTEAAIDFPEDVESQSCVGELAELHRDIEALVATGALGHALREGLSVALVGATNAGKSSLFNALIGRERALVAPEPGTTRDFVEADLTWSGVPITLIDTAGDRIADGLESRGIELGRVRAAEADLELVVVEAGTPAPAIEGTRQLLVWSKVDQGASGAGGIATSAISGEGLATLRETVVSRGQDGCSLEERVLLVSARQRALVSEALDCCGRALAAARSGRPAELIAADLTGVRSALARVLGEEISDEMLDELFAQFCIGK